jgi:hypothetical protein
MEELRKDLLFRAGRVKKVNAGYRLKGVHES